MAVRSALTAVGLMVDHSFAIVSRESLRLRSAEVSVGSLSLARPAITPGGPTCKIQRPAALLKLHDQLPCLATVPCSDAALTAASSTSNI